jgi:DNA polymerase III alpha subunit
VYETEIKKGKNAGKMRKTRPNKKVVESLIYAGAFDGIDIYEGQPLESISEDDEDKTAKLRATLLNGYNAIKKDKKAKVALFDKKSTIEKELGVIGMCLSEPPLTEQYREMISSNKWNTIDNVGDKSRALVFGQIAEIRAHTSRKGNAMHIVTLSDGIDSMSFFVFDGARQFFFDNYRNGMIVAMPLRRFEDGDARFFDEYKKGIVIEE